MHREPGFFAAWCSKTCIGREITWGLDRPAAAAGPLPARVALSRAGYRSPGGAATASGTGLGLSIVKSLVDLHEGVVEVGSQPVRGTVFHVLLPAATTEPGDTRELMRGRRILIVEEESETAELVAGQLAPLDVESTIVGTGAAALSTLASERYDAVALGVLTPDPDGVSVVREIRDDPELQLTPIVFMSTEEDRSGLTGEWVVVKPIDPDRLRGALAAAVRAARARVLVMPGKRCSRCSSPPSTTWESSTTGRRLQRAMILCTDGKSSTPAGILMQGTPVVAVKDAPQALLAALRGRPARDELMTDGAQNRD